MLLLLRPFDYWSHGHPINEGQVDLTLLRMQRTLAQLQAQQSLWREELEMETDLLVMFSA